MSDLPDTVTVWMPAWDPEKGNLRNLYDTSWRGHQFSFESGKRYEVPRAFAEGFLSKVRMSNVDEPDEFGEFRSKRAFMIRENGQAFDEAVEAKKKVVAGTPENPIRMVPPEPKAPEPKAEVAPAVKELPPPPQSKASAEDDDAEPAAPADDKADPPTKPEKRFKF